MGFALFIEMIQDKPLQQEKIKRILQPLLWDYHIEADDFYRIALGQKAGIGFLHQQQALLRILERLSWYDILELFDCEFLKNHITSDLISKMRFPATKRKYEILRKILHGQSVSFPEWSAETRQRAQNAILSNRWYSTEPSLF